jgi:bromodomain-containing factor 1
MSGRRTRLVFTFSSESFRRHNTQLPRVTFTCTALAKNTLPPYLRFCLKFLEYLKDRPDSHPFHFPVPNDPIIAPEYHNIIKYPMDFSTIARKIYDEQYPDILAFKADVDLIWANCATYNRIGSELRRIGFLIKGDFDELWNLHTSITDGEVALRSVESIVAAHRLCDEDLSLANPSMQLFRVPEYIKLKKPTVERIQHFVAKERDKDGKPSYTAPTDDLLNQPLTTKERYELAVAINTLPPELLGEVIEILSKALGLRKDQEFEIPFSSLDTATFRTIEAYVKHAKDKEPIVRRMYQHDTIAAEKQLEILQAELDRIRKALSEKHPQHSGSEFTSEGDTTDGFGGTDSGSGGESEESSSDE